MKATEPNQAASEAPDIEAQNPPIFSNTPFFFHTASRPRRDRAFRYNLLPLRNPYHLKAALTNGQKDFRCNPWPVPNTKKVL